MVTSPCFSFSRRRHGDAILFSPQFYWGFLFVYPSPENLPVIPAKSPVLSKAEGPNGRVSWSKKGLVSLDYGRFCVKIGNLCLTLLVKIGYNANMIEEVVSFALRISLIATLCLFVWRYVKPRTQLMRVFRAALLVLVLLAVLVVLRVTGPN